MSVSHPDPDLIARTRSDVISWFASYGRNLPMRADSVTPWASLVFEVMSQQTPVARVTPAWLRWMQRWPTPEALAKADTADVLLEWDSLGYPSRALRLRECATVLQERHGGSLPHSFAALTALPGIGPYTASALLSFRFHQRIAVLDTNVRRVLARIFMGVALPASSAPTRAEKDLATFLLPEDGDECAAWNEGLMEYGALVCTQSAPACHSCDLIEVCEWAQAGYPPPEKRPKVQRFTGTDRQARGRIMALLREAHKSGRSTVTYADALQVAHLPGADPAQAPRVFRALLADSLISYDEAKDRVSLPMNAQATPD